jgi:4-amino-4-deoxy-L-arabinose transferase
MTGIIFLLSSVFLHIKDKNNYSVLALFFAAFCFFFFAALLDPYLNLWDERFHALVAKNILVHPLRPTLYEDPAVEMDYSKWASSIVWLHKQPFFLWLIALSFKCFGINEIALRLPSVLLSSFLIVIAYRTGKLLVNSKVGYCTAFLFTTSFYLLELVSGKQNVDHNDVIFLCTVSASIWAWVEYYYSKKKVWLILIGLFSGSAVLCKWLIGLLVFVGWGIQVFYKWWKEKKISIPWDCVIALLIALMVALPWQIYILLNYHSEAMAAYAYNSAHFTTAIEGHGGPWWIYLANLKILYGLVVQVLLPISLFLLYKKINTKSFKIVFVALPVIVYLFFSIAKTKMASFPFVVTLPIFLSIACMIDFILIKFSGIKISQKLKQIVIFVFIMCIGVLNFRFTEIRQNHSLSGKDSEYLKMMIDNKKIYQELPVTYPANSVVMNVKGIHYVECMFYSGFPAYNFIPSEEQFNDLKKKGRPLIVFKRSNEELPEYLTSDKSVTIITDNMQEFD